MFRIWIVVSSILIGVVTADARDLRLDRPITSDVAADLVAAIDMLPPGRHRLILDSLGGVVRAAFRIEDAMLSARSRHVYVDTIVPDGARCASMCVNVLLSGARRYASPVALIAIHAAHRASSPTVVDQQGTTMIMDDVMARLGVSGAIFVASHARAFASVTLTRVNADDLRAAGVIFTSF